MAKKPQTKAISGKTEKTGKTNKTDKKNHKKTAVKGADTEKPVVSGAIILEEKEVDEEKISPDALEALLDDEAVGADEMDLDSDDDSEEEEADWE